MDSTLGIVLVAAVFAGLAWGVSRLIGRTDRNADPGSGFDASSYSDGH